ncbi:MAG: hypothetical protein HZA54_01335, partial [Planctomycetes bacterium]|nr:hypothetical protein [Planctomycetota bacterium]
MKIVWATLATLLLLPLATAYGEDPKSTADRLAALERKMQALADENAALRVELNGLKAAPAAVPPAPAPVAPAASPAAAAPAAPAPARKEVSIQASF